MSDSLTVRKPYQAAGQQREADMMGMYLFLASELMLFGGLIAAIMLTRVLHPHEFVVASKKLNIWIGAANTLILLTSSLFVAVAVEMARGGRRRYAAASFSIAAVLGLGFLALKGFEYWTEYADGLLPAFGEPTRFAGPVEHLFMDFYLIATGLHAFHVSAGIVLLVVVATKIGWGRLRVPERAIVVELSGLYWHLVDVVWVFLYPILYLAR